MRIEQAVRQSLADLIPEDLGVDLVSAGAVKEIVESDTTLRLVVRLGYPCQSRLPALRALAVLCGEHLRTRAGQLRAGAAPRP